VLDSAGYVGGEVGKDCFDMGEIKPAGHVLRGIVDDNRHIERQRTENLAY
jgi:hypothetical protein